MRTLGDRGYFGTNYRIQMGEGRYNLVLADHQGRYIGTHDTAFNEVTRYTFELKPGNTRPSLYIDFESASERAKLFDPERYLPEHEDELVILDGTPGSRAVPEPSGIDRPGSETWQACRTVPASGIGVDGPFETVGREPRRSHRLPGAGPSRRARIQRN
jgi:hypothetical protein